MVVYAESGEFVTPRQDKDKGTFTIQGSDVPLACSRRKNRKGVKQELFHRKKVRLTPINEYEEVNVRDEAIETPECEGNETERTDCEKTMSPISITLTSPDGESRDVHKMRSFERSDTPAVHRKSCDTKLFLDLDTFEEELENIPEIGNNVRDPELLYILSELPPRPKCKRKVLPPSVTTGVDTLKPKKKKLLKLRSKLENSLDNASYSISKDLQQVIKRQSLEVLAEQRPKSAEDGVRVITLSDLSSVNSSSVPDLPTILNKIAKSNDLKELSRLGDQTNERGIKTFSKSSIFDDSGALSTPRDDSDVKLGDRTDPIQKVTTEKCLKGSDIASFYHMWDRDRNSRPFDKKGSDKFKISTHRDCLCSIRNCARKCFNQRNNVLPPIASPSRDI